MSWLSRPKLPMANAELAVTLSASVRRQSAGGIWALYWKTGEVYIKHKFIEGKIATCPLCPAESSVCTAECFVCKKNIEGTPVRGTTLLRLRSADLEDRRTQLLGDISQNVEKLQSLAIQLLDPSGQLRDYERANLTGQQNEAEIQLETLRKKWLIFEREVWPDLTITSPMDGVVVSWDVRTRLQEKRPISRMAYVLEVADLDGEWQLELLMPEKRMGYIMEQQRRHPDKPLRVGFRLATKSDTTYYGTVREIHDRAEVRTDSGSAGAMSSNLNTVAMKVDLDDFEAFRSDTSSAGAEVSAHIDCGYKPLGYVLFYEVIIYIQKNILFRWF